jgi:hypothetical protein
MQNAWDGGSKWSLLAAMVVMAGLAAAMWWLFGGCEPQRPEGPQAQPPAVPERAVAVAQAMRDANVAELSFQIACFYRNEKRLPASLDELRRSPPVGGGPPAPAVTTRGEPIAYHPGADRTYALAVGGAAGESGPTPVAFSQEVPANMPAQMDPDSLRVWWDLEYLKQAAGKLTGSAD